MPVPFGLVQFVDPFGQNASSGPGSGAGPGPGLGGPGHAAAPTAIAITTTRVPTTRFTQSTMALPLTGSPIQIASAGPLGHSQARWQLDKRLSKSAGRFR